MEDGSEIMNDALTWVEHFIEGLRASHALKVLVTCWCLGFLLKKWRWLRDNNVIPLVVIPVGAFFSLVTDTHHTDGLTVDQEKWDGAAIGLFLSTLAWVSHKFVWKNLGKIPVIGQYLDTGNSNPDNKFDRRKDGIDYGKGLPPETGKDLLGSKENKPLK